MGEKRKEKRGSNREGGGKGKEVVSGKRECKEWCVGIFVKWKRSEMKGKVKKYKEVSKMEKGRERRI